MNIFYIKIGDFYSRPQYRRNNDKITLASKDLPFRKFIIFSSVFFDSRFFLLSLHLQSITEK